LCRRGSWTTDVAGEERRVMGRVSTRGPEEKTELCPLPPWIVVSSLSSSCVVAAVNSIAIQALNVLHVDVWAAVCKVLRGSAHSLFTSLHVSIVSSIKSRQVKGRCITHNMTHAPKGLWTVEQGQSCLHEDSSLFWLVVGWWRELMAEGVAE
jgi:hypothetical protein